MPRDFQNSGQERVGQRGLSAISSFYDELQAELNRRLSKKYKVNPFLSSVLEDSEAIIQEFQEILADILGDSFLASWLVGAGELAHQFDPELYRRLGFGEPPINPPIISLAEDWGWEGMHVWLPLVNKSVERLKELRVYTKEDFALLSDQLRKDAFTVAGLQTTEAVAKVHKALIDSVQEGTGLVEFKEALDESLGTSALGPGHLENVMRTGQSRAYSDGINKIHSHPLVRPAFPYVETLPIRDNRLTDLCNIISEAGIQGTGIFRVDDPVWIKFDLPRHWQERCSKRFLTIEDAAAKGIEEAIRWLDGDEPTHPAFVDEPVLDPESRKLFESFRSGQ